MADFIEADETMGNTPRFTILNRCLPAREFFDPKKKAHRDSAKKFLETGKWGNILFHAEHPYVDVPTTILVKLANHQLKVKREA
jgi:hypothetical protein